MNSIWIFRQWKQQKQRQWYSGCCCHKRTIDLKILCTYQASSMKRSSSLGELPRFDALALRKFPFWKNSTIRFFFFEGPLNWNFLASYIWMVQSLRWRFLNFNGRVFFTIRSERALSAKHLVGRPWLEAPISPSSNQSHFTFKTIASNYLSFRLVELCERKVSISWKFCRNKISRISQINSNAFVLSMFGFVIFESCQITGNDDRRA